LPSRIIGMQPMPIADTFRPWPSVRYFMIVSCVQG
jgi:hypothetical protein